MLFFSCIFNFICIFTCFSLFFIFFFKDTATTEFYTYLHTLSLHAALPILMVCVTERVPVLDMVRVKRRLEGSGSRLVGPNSQGIMVPGRCKIGVMPAHLQRPGKVGIVSRSASLTSEVIDQISAHRLGEEENIGIGGDPVHGMGFVDCLKLFFADPDTDCVVLLGEIGGSDEEEAAAFLAANPPPKPVVAYVAGLHAPTERRMGHAGTGNVFGQGDAAGKIAALRDAGVAIAASPAEIGLTVRQAVRA